MPLSLIEVIELLAVVVADGSDWFMVVCVGELCVCHSLIWLGVAHRYDDHWKWESPEKLS